MELKSEKRNDGDRVSASEAERESQIWGSKSVHKTISSTWFEKQQQLESYLTHTGIMTEQERERANRRESAEERERER